MSQAALNLVHSEDGARSRQDVLLQTEIVRPASGRIEHSNLLMTSPRQSSTHTFGEIRRRHPAHLQTCLTIIEARDARGARQA